VSIEDARRTWILNGGQDSELSPIDPMPLTGTAQASRRARLVMKLLTPHIPYDVAETVQSYAARSSLFHTGQGPMRLLEDCGVKPARFRAGHRDEVARFAAAVGEGIGGVQLGTIQTLSRYNHFRGEDFSRAALSTHVRQFCPHCLREDGPPAEWRHRLIWCFLPIPICLRHRSRLVEVTHGTRSIFAMPSRVPEASMWPRRRRLTLRTVDMLLGYMSGFRSCIALAGWMDKALSRC
jgi:hypothetical protein